MTEETNPAAGAPFERPVRPRALLLEHRDGRETLHPIDEYALAYRDTAIGQHLLYDQAALDAAVAAERERLALMAESQEDNAGFHSLSADEIRRGRLGNEGMG